MFEDKISWLSAALNLTVDVGLGDRSRPEDIPRVQNEGYTPPRENQPGPEVSTSGECPNADEKPVDDFVSRNVADELALAFDPFARCARSDSASTAMTSLRSGARSASAGVVNGARGRRSPHGFRPSADAGTTWFGRRPPWRIGAGYGQILRVNDRANHHRGHVSTRPSPEAR